MSSNVNFLIGVAMGLGGSDIAANSASESAPQSVAIPPTIQTAMIAPNDGRNGSSWFRQPCGESHDPVAVSLFWLPSQLVQLLSSISVLPLSAITPTAMPITTPTTR